jgi:DNA polymerase-4
MFPVNSEHTGLNAASREAKAFQMPARRFRVWAGRLCPDVGEVTSPDDVDLDLCRLIVALVETVLPVWAVCSTDRRCAGFWPRSRPRPPHSGEKREGGFAGRRLPSIGFPTRRNSKPPRRALVGCGPRQAALALGCTSAM